MSTPFASSHLLSRRVQLLARTAAPSGGGPLMPLSADACEAISAAVVERVERLMGDAVGISEWRALKKINAGFHNAAV